MEPHVAYIGRNQDYDPGCGPDTCSWCGVPAGGYAVMDDTDVVCSGFCTPDCATQWGQLEVVTTVGYSPDEQEAYCANYCVGEHHMACARRDVDNQEVP